MNRFSVGRLSCGLAGLLIAFSAPAATWYVDDDNYGKPDLDGKTEATAFGALQDAMDNADLKDDDTVLVLPGVYTNGATVMVGANTRIGISKSIKLVAKAGKDVTHIVGAPDPGTGACGPQAVRCIGVSHQAKGTEIRGFTIRNGCTANITGQSGSYRGGGVYVNTDSAWVVDCVVSNCISSMGAMFQGTAVRTWFTGNRACDSVSYSVGYTTKYHSCLLSDNGHPSKYHTSGGRAVNTTFALNATNVHGIAGSSSVHAVLYNCVILAAEKYSYLDLHDCSVARYSLIAPALNDFRVKAGGAADGTGNRMWLDGNETGVHLPSGEPLLDFHGNPYPESGPIHMGCIQETVEAGGGLLKIGALGHIEGFPVHQNASYLYPVQYPCQYRVLPNLDEGERVACYNLSPATRNWRLPESDDGLTVMPPPLSGGQYAELAIAPRRAATAIHVDTPQNGGSDSEGDGSRDAPFATIQKAVDSAVDDVHTLILVGPGTYGEGEAHYPKDSTGNEVVVYGKASVTVHEKKRVRILAEEGPESTVLLGAADPTYANESTLPGCGPNAAKCIIFLKGDVGNGIQGFTLTGGHSTRAADANIEGDKANSGGAWYSVSGYACIADCIVSNNVANLYAAGAAGVLDRLYVSGNHGSGTVGSHPLFASSCVFADNPSARSNYGVIGEGSRAYNCTIVESDASALAAYNIYSARIYNSIAVGGKTIGNSTEFGSSIIWGQPALPASKGYFHGNPHFADEEDGDYRVKSYSPATRMWGISDTLYYQHTSTDFFGNRIVSEGGKAAIGALAETVDADELYIRADNGGVSVTGGTIGLNAGPDQNITLNPAVAWRPCTGYLVNGVTNLFADLPDGQLVVAPQQVTAAGGILIEALYDNNWYVDADNGSDQNPGFSTLPKKTLAAAMSMADSGDVVNAAPGDYNEGLMGQNATCMISSRVVVASGVLLRSLQGPDVTFITGADATVNPVKTGEFAGCGTNAVRCVYLCANAKVQGFTLRHGRFRGDSLDVDDTRSGGVLSGTPETSIVQDCIITDCFGYRGGALYGAKAVRCFIADCKSRDGAIGKIAYLHGCVVGSMDNGVSHPKILSNCTFLPECANPISGYFTASTPVRNSIITGLISAKESNPVYLYNCVVAEGAISEAAAPYVHMTDCLVTNIEAIALMDDGRIAAGSCAIDFGSNDYVHSDGTDVDFGGGQRIYNGVVDVGAYEYDWRKSYADTVLPRLCTVENASPEVVQGEGKVLVNGTLDTVIAGPGTGRRYGVEIPVKVTGNGVLDVVRGGETVASYTAADGVQMYGYKSLCESETVSFAYTPGESDTGCAEIGRGNIESFAFTVIIR